MDSVSFQATNKLEKKLIGIYEALYTKKSKVAAKINRYTKVNANHNAHNALILHLILNGCALALLFGLLY